PHICAKALRTSAGKLRMCSGFQAGSKRCRVPRANAGDVRLAVASNPMAIGASFIIGLLAGGSICSMADDFCAGSRAGVVSADTRKTVPSGGQTNKYVPQSSLGDDVRYA